MHTQVLLHRAVFFFFYDTTTTKIYTLSLHDALPIWPGPSPGRSVSPTSIRGPCTAASPSPDRKRTRLNSSHVAISYAVFSLKKKKVEKATSGSSTTMKRNI